MLVILHAHQEIVPVFGRADTVTDLARSLGRSHFSAEWSGPIRQAYPNATSDASIDARTPCRKFVRLARTLSEHHDVTSLI